MLVRTPQDLIDRPVPDLVLASSDGGSFSLRSRIGVGPLVLFFIIKAGTSG
jgi:hypothetical protein